MNCTGKNLCLNLFFIKVTGFYSATLFKKEPPVYVFSKKSLRDVFYGTLTGNYYQIVETANLLLYLEWLAFTRGSNSWHETS